MMTQSPAAGRRPSKAARFSLAALLLVAGLPLAAQDRSHARPGNSGSPGRSAHSTSSSSSPSAHGSSSSGSREPRHAQPTGPDGSSSPHRQPPSRGGRDDDGHHGGGSHGGGWWYGGGWYGGGYYYYPYGFWPRLWWGWYNDPYTYGPYGEPRYYGRGGEAGALDLDVYPGRTEVYVDGQAIGKVDAFDGWPRYLWLPKGTYDIVFYLDGYRTIARQITVYPGSVIDIDDRMEPGDSVRPEDLASKTHERRDDRLRYEQERRERIERGDDRDSRGTTDEDWRDRVRRERMRDRDDDVRGEDIEEGRPAMGDRGRLHLEVDPEDASVYLDGKFVGTGTDLGLLRGGLPVSAGEHTLSVVRPGHKSEETEFRVKAGEEVRIEVELDDADD